MLAPPPPPTYQALLVVLGQEGVEPEQMVVLGHQNEAMTLRLVVK